MPTSTLRLAGLRNLMQLGSVMQPSYRPNDVLIGPWSWCAIGEELNAYVTTALTSSAYPAASRVLAYQFEIAAMFLVQKTWWINGTTATTDTADVGVYNEAGTTLIVHAGAAIATANVVQEGDPTDTLLTPGRYWCAYIQGGTTATPMAALLNVTTIRMAGCAQMAGAGSTLGATFTPAAMASAVFPIFGIAGRTQVA
jgi:hypothetical protein